MLIARRRRTRNTEIAEGLARTAAVSQLGDRTPRPVELTGLGMTLVALAFALLIGAGVGGILLQNAIDKSAARREAFDKQARETQGWISEVRNIKKENATMVYQYRVDGRSYEKSQRLKGRPARYREIGAPLPVFYLPGDPESAWPQGYEPRRMPWFLSLLVPTGLLAAIWPIYLGLRRERRLLEYGRVAEARVIDSKKQTSAHMGTENFRVTYEFQLYSGATKRVSRELTKKPLGSVATIVYDRNSYNTWASYPMHLYRVAKRPSTVSPRYGDR